MKIEEMSESPKPRNVLKHEKYEILVLKKHQKGHIAIYLRENSEIVNLFNIFIYHCDLRSHSRKSALISPEISSFSIVSKEHVANTVMLKMSNNSSFGKVMKN